MKYLYLAVFILIGWPFLSNAGEFEERCADPNVVRCYGFDDIVDLTTANPQGTTPYEPESRMYGSADDSLCSLGDGSRCWDLDTNTKVSGASSLRFEVPSNSEANTSGSFRLNFADDYSQRFGEGEEFFVQYRYRLSPEMLRAFEGGGGFKSIIVGNGDSADGPTQYSCTTLESVITTDNRYLGPNWYFGCGYFYGLDRWENGTCNQVRLTDIVNDSPPTYCCYGGEYPNGCWQWSANEWLTLQMHIRIGQWNVEETSRVRVWAAREGEASVLLFDSDVGGTSTAFKGKIINDDPANVKYGKLWLLPYNTNKDSAESHPTGYVWYDDLIISRTRIPDPGAPTADYQAPAAPTNLKVQ